MVRSCRRPPSAERQIEANNTRGASRTVLGIKGYRIDHAFKEGQIHRQAEVGGFEQMIPLEKIVLTADQGPLLGGVEGEIQAIGRHAGHGVGHHGLDHETVGMNGPPLGGKPRFFHHVFQGKTTAVVRQQAALADLGVFGHIDAFPHRAPVREPDPEQPALVVFLACPGRRRRLESEGSGAPVEGFGGQQGFLTGLFLLGGAGQDKNQKQKNPSRTPHENQPSRYSPAPGPRGRPSSSQITSKIIQPMVNATE